MIDFKSTLKIALNSLKVNKMRSALTSLGIIIGVAAVIVMLAIGEGANKQVQANMESMGSNLLTIRSATAKTGGVSMGMGTKPTLSVKDADAIKRTARGIESVAPLMNSSKQVMYGNQNWSTTVYGITASYLYVKNYEMDLGRPINRDDDNNASKVCIIGKTIERELFGDVNPIDKTIRVGNVPFRVIGTLKAKGQMGPMDQDDLIFIPLTTAQRKVFGTDFPGAVNQIIVKALSIEDTTIAQQDINDILRRRHSLGKTQENDFEIRNSAEFQEKMKSTVQTFAILLASIASVSLVVGGIGIMNIMLVSVTERTKEIGIRMAIGARAMDIRMQFLIEALVLSLLGGLIGVISGIAVALFVGFAFSTNVVISIAPILLSFGFSGLVGIGFGYYPAYKASLLNPIDALRYE
ncbi:MAG: FtsX-like permease family protein [Cyanobacteria bacterium SIG31]|nr:FtsX-like permease family protein [Cyanobacteria bacterium SIG31]